MVTPEKTLNSNYGAYVFRDRQLDYAVECLRRDRESRRAVISILNPSHLFTENTDVPCTVSLDFLIRKGKLYCSVVMRSCDAIYGMSNDVPFFSFVHEAVLVSLNEKRWVKLELGILTLFTHSLHVYERHFDMLEKLLTEKVEPVDCPRLAGKFEVDLLRMGVVPAELEKYPFTGWLHDREKKQ